MPEVSSFSVFFCVTYLSGSLLVCLDHFIHYSLSSCGLYTREGVFGGGGGGGRVLVQSKERAKERKVKMLSVDDVVVGDDDYDDDKMF